MTAKPSTTKTETKKPAKATTKVPAKKTEKKPLSARALNAKIDERILAALSVPAAPAAIRKAVCVPAGKLTQRLSFLKKQGKVTLQDNGKTTLWARTI